jgi:tetratricopeptide (TPR) repeat protein
MALATPTARAQARVDRVHRQNGVDSGQIVGVTALGITISKSGVESTIPVEDIESVYISGEPDDLNSVRTALQAGRLNDAVRNLEGIAAAPNDRDEVRAEVDFFNTLVAAKLALAGQGDLAEATAKAREFLTSRRTSFHVPRVIELVGDLLGAAGDHAGARAEYAKLAKAPSDYFVLLSALLVGRAWQAEGKHGEALAEFDKVLASAESGPRIEALKLAATLDRAVSQAASGDGAKGAEGIVTIIDATDAEDAEALARAYVALGECYLNAGDKQGALFAFLHVDLLYDDAADAHAKALHELVELWRDAGRETRSQDAARELAEKYPASRWARGGNAR